MNDRAARDIRTYGTLVLILLAAGTFLITLVPYLRGASIPTYTLYLTVAFVVIGAILGYITFPTKRLTEFIARRRAENAPAPPDLTRELLALATTTERVWSVDASFVDSFALGNLNILNEINQQMAKMDPTLRMFAQEANGVISGWRCQRPTHQFLAKQLDTFAEFGVGMNENTLLVVLGALVSLALTGANTANAFAQAISNTGLDVSKFVRQGWNAFANKANRLSEDLSKLGEKVKVATGVDLKVYIPQVSSL